MESSAYRTSGDERVEADRRVATAFMNVLFRHDWNSGVVLPPEDVQVFMDLVKAAGFEPKGVVPGQIRGDYLDQDGTPTGDTYAVNGSCPCKVVGQDGKDDYVATGWLDAVFSLAQNTQSDPYERSSRIAFEIGRSVPLEPIQLTAEWDRLLEYPPSRNSSCLVDHARDDRRLTGCVGLHEICGGWFDRRQSSRHYDVIVCRQCLLRVPFPPSVETYGDLRSVLRARLHMA